MKYIKRFFEYYLHKSYSTPEEKMAIIVDELLDQKRGGSQFFDKLDDVIKDEKNLDITIGLFKKIYDNYGSNYNLALTGSFGKRIVELIDKGIISYNGKYVLFNGSITSHRNKLGKISINKKVEVKTTNISKWYKNIKNYDFIFVDDSFYSGTTYTAIKTFLRKFHSDIKVTYVIYDGSDKKDDNINSMYRYYDNHNGTKWSKNTLIKNLNKIDKAPIKEIEDLILSGTIETNKELIDNINIQWKKLGIDRYIDPRRFNFSSLL
jgi:pyrimidine operon attenuation protein/uracil phosphoribosyltransferase